MAENSSASYYILCEDFLIPDVCVVKGNDHLLLKGVISEEETVSPEIFMYFFSNSNPNSNLYSKINSKPNPNPNPNSIFYLNPQKSK